MLECTKGSRKKKCFFIVARPLRGVGGGVKGLATKNKLKYLKILCYVQTASGELAAKGDAEAAGQPGEARRDVCRLQHGSLDQTLEL